MRDRERGRGGYREREGGGAGRKRRERRQREREGWVDRQTARDKECMYHIEKEGGQRERAKRERALEEIEKQTRQTRKERGGKKEEETDRQPLIDLSLFNHYGCHGNSSLWGRPATAHPAAGSYWSHDVHYYTQGGREID